MSRSYYYNAKIWARESVREMKTNPEHDQLKFSTWPQRQGCSIRLGPHLNPFGPRPHTDAGGLFNYDREVETLDRWKHIAFITCRQPPRRLWMRQTISESLSLSQTIKIPIRTHAPCLTDPWPCAGVRRRSELVSRAERERQSGEIKINTTLQSDLTRVVHKIWLIGWKCWPLHPQFPLPPLS